MAADNGVPRAVAILQENMDALKAYINEGKPLPERNKDDADERLFALLDFLCNYQDPAWAELSSDMRRYLDHANKNMKDAKLAEDMLADNLPNYLAKAIMQDSGNAGPKYPGLYLAALQYLNGK